MDLQKIISKIEKLLKLAESGNEYEAANAMQRAQTLMSKHNIHMDDVELAEYDEVETDLDFANKVPDYVSYLVAVVNKAFGTQALYSTIVCHTKTQSYKRRSVNFVGPKHVAKLASYTFTILFRQLTKARSEYLSNLEIWMTRKEKISMGDLYCHGWIKTINSKVQDFANPDRDKKIDKFINKQHGELDTQKTNDRIDENLPNFLAADAYQSGMSDSKNVSLNTPMEGQETAKLESK